MPSTSHLYLFQFFQELEKYHLGPKDSSYLPIVNHADKVTLSKMNYFSICCGCVCVCGCGGMWEVCVGVCGSVWGGSVGGMWEGQRV